MRIAIYGHGTRMRSTRSTNRISTYFKDINSKKARRVKLLRKTINGPMNWPKWEEKQFNSDSQWIDWKRSCDSQTKSMNWANTEQDCLACLGATKAAKEF